jgi:hypothetical protein
MGDHLMPSFRFRGFTDASTVALTIGQGAQSAGADLVWAQALTEAPASFEIARFDGIPDAELVAPVALWFTPTNIQGFHGVDDQPISEPAGDTNVYDPTAIEIFWSWDFDDPGYEPLVQSNLPLQLRDVNKAFAKRPCHVFHGFGRKTVRLFGYDTRGRWGTAEYVFGEGGQSPEIANPDDGFFTGREVYFSQDGIFPPDSPPLNRCTTELQVQQRLSTLWNSGGVTFGRLRLRRGEEYVDLATDLGNFRNLYIDSYGDPEAPPPKQIRSGTAAGGAKDGPFAISNGATGSPRIIDQDWQGPYDATTETGLRTDALIRNSARNGRRHLIHRVRISGASFYHDNFQSDSFRVFSDVQITNWQDYGMFINSGGARLSLAIIGGDWAQPANALSGTHHGVGNSNFANLTNRHGPIRCSSMTRDLYVACASFMSRNGWSQRSGPGAGDTNPGTLAQACFRHGGSDSASWRNYATWERCSFEGGAGAIHFVDLGAQEPSNDYVSNVLIDSNLIIASRDTEMLVIGKGRGMSARNNYFFVPGTTHMYNPNAPITFRHQEFINWRFDGSVDPNGPSRAFVFSNTGYILADNAQIGAPATRVIAKIADGHNPVQENNIHFAPNLSPMIGDTLPPLESPTLADFRSRFLGTRFNFPPIGHDSMGPLITAESVRELSPGGTTGVADGEWISLPYPDYTGKCNGALGQVTRAMVESALPVSGAVRYHQVSLYGHNVKAAASAEAGGDGKVAFAFTDTAIRVQNLSGITWTGNLWVLLDLRDRLMDFVPGTANPQFIPLLVPATMAGATSSGLLAPYDILRTQRNLPAVPGAFVPAI